MNVEIPLEWELLVINGVIKEMLYGWTKFAYLRALPFSNVSKSSPCHSFFPTDGSFDFRNQTTRPAFWI